MTQTTASQIAFDFIFNSTKTSLIFNNSTSNIQQHRGRDTQGQSIPIASVSLLIIIAFLGAIGNLLVLKAIFSLKKRKLHEYLILNLAATDAGICLVSFPLDIAEQLIGGFPYGAALCHVIYPFQSVLVYVSVLTLLFMSVERYRLIVTPMKPRIHAKCGRITIVAIWLVSCLIVLPFSFALKLEGIGCSEQWPHAYSGKVFTLTIFTFLYLIPLIMMTVFYSSVIRFLYKDIKSLKVRRKISINWQSIDTRLQRNIKIVKVFVMAVIVFAVSMLPTHITWLWHDFGHGSLSPDFGKVATFSNIVMYANCFLNSCIFGSIVIDVGALVKRCRELVCWCSRRVTSSVRFEQPFVLHICSPSMSQQYKNGSYFLSLSKSSLCDNETVTGTKIISNGGLTTMNETFP